LRVGLPKYAPAAAVRCTGTSRHCWISARICGSGSDARSGCVQVWLPSSCPPVLMASAIEGLVANHRPTAITVAMA